MSEPLSPNAADALKTVLDSGRPASARLELLRTLREELRAEPALQALLSAAREEKTLKVRKAFFEHAASSDITRISDRARFIDGILYFAAIEDDAALRRSALSRIADWSGHSPLIEDILMETLLSDLELATQRVCVTALETCLSRRPENVARLLEFIPHSSAALRTSLIGLLRKLDAQALQAGLVALLDPAESDELRALALAELAAVPQLAPPTLAALQTLALNALNPDLQTQALAILRDAKQVDGAFLDAVLALFVKLPARAELLDAIRGRIASFPELAPKLAALFPTIPSARTRARMLQALIDAPLVPLFLNALRDPNWRVRLATIECCRRHQSRNAAEIESAVLQAARDEQSQTVREAMAALFSETARRSVEVQRELVGWFERETEPRVERALTPALRGVAPSSENGPTLLRAWRKMLSRPDKDPQLRAMILGQIRNAAFQDHPELADCIRVLLQRASSIEDVDTLYARLRELEPDAARHAELLLTLFFRFAGHYPREPLHRWLKDFEALAPTHAEIREQLPFIIQLTGASWLSGSAETQARKEIVLPALLIQVRKGNWIESRRLLRESWESRTIRKSDMLALFRKLLRAPGEEGLLQECLVMMAKGGLTTPEILDTCFAYLEEFPAGGSYTYLLKDFVQGRNQDNTPLRSIDAPRPADLETPRKQDPHYRAQVFAHFTQQHLTRSFQGIPEELPLPPRPKNWNEWEYELWSHKDTSWHFAEMFLALDRFEQICEILAAPPAAGVSPARSIQYLLLVHLWRLSLDKLPKATIDQGLRALGALLHNTAGNRALAALHDRALLVFRTWWLRRVNSYLGGRTVSADLSELAAEVYAELCRIGAQLDAKEQERFPAVFPEMLQGLDARRLQALWTFGAPAWECIFKEHFEGGEQDALARTKLEQAQLAEADARFEDAFALYKELSGPLAETRIYKKARSTIAQGLEDCDPSTAVPPDDEKSAAAQFEFMSKQFEKTRIEQALHSLNRFIKRYWRTAFYKTKRDELLAKKSEFETKVPRPE